MHDTVGQTMCLDSGEPKGMKLILEERGINTTNLKGPDVRIILGNHSDFQAEQPRVIQYLTERGHRGLFSPKFHPELNPIERVWAQSKIYTKVFCKIYPSFSMSNNT